jgi:hypothetical protein
MSFNVRILSDYCPIFCSFFGCKSDWNRMKIWSNLNRIQIVHESEVPIGQKSWTNFFLKIGYKSDRIRFPIFVRFPFDNSGENRTEIVRKSESFRMRNSSENRTDFGRPIIDRKSHDFYTIKIGWISDENRRPIFIRKKSRELILQGLFNVTKPKNCNFSVFWWIFRIFLCFLGFYKLKNDAVFGNEFLRIVSIVWIVLLRSFLISSDQRQRLFWFCKNIW